MFEDGFEVREARPRKRRSHPYKIRSFKGANIQWLEYGKVEDFAQKTTPTVTQRSEEYHRN